MSRKTTTIEDIENVEGKTFSVELIEELSWGEVREIQSEMTSNADMEVQRDDVSMSLGSNAFGKYSQKVLEVAIAKIEDEEGNEVEFSQEWADKLTVQSGNKLFNIANDKIDVGGKKKATN